MLTSNGHALGTLCVIDRVPRDLDQNAQLALEALARQVMAQLELRRHIRKLEEIQGALRESEERFDLAIRGTNDDIWDWMDVKQDAEWWSPRFYHLLGYEHNEFPSSLSKFKELLHPDDHERTFQVVRDHFERSEPFDLEYRLRTKSGEYQWFQGRGNTVRDEVGRPLRMAGSIQDITERKQRESEIVRQGAELARSNSDLEQFASVAAHDLQEPLRMVSGYAQLLEKRYAGKLDADADEFIAYAVDGANRMQTLIRDLLEYSRVGRGERHIAMFESDEIVRKAVQNLHTLIEETHAQILRDALPKVRGDAVRLIQVFQNLFANAIKFRDPSTSPRIQVWGEQRESAWIFSVQDNGIGIDPVYGTKIFDVFQRLHGRTQYSGTGIGLAICKRVVEDHGGQIWVESVPGQGSKFFFTIACR